MAQSDNVLQFYNRVLGLDQTHFGMWEPNTELTLPNMQKAVLRYTDALLSKIPSDVKQVLDVGCGFGGISRELSTRGYGVIALTPDYAQKKHFASTNPVTPLIFSTFEDCPPQSNLDLILMSESCQYIDTEKGTNNCNRFLREGGYVLIGDYFLKPSSKKSPVRNSGHILDDYLSSMDRNGFQLEDVKDITNDVLPTVQFAGQFLGDVISNNGEVSQFANELLRPGRSNTENMIFSGGEQARLLFDASEFLEHKSYLILLFKKNN